VSITGEFENDATPTASPVSETTTTPSPTRRPVPATARLEGFQHQFQTWNNCGPATVAMALTYFGLAIGQQETATVLKPDPEDRNVSPHEMVAYVNEHTAYSALWRANGSLETVKQLLAAGFPVIIELGIDPPGEYRWLGWYGHYLLLTAYDDGAEQVWVYDSWFGTSDVPMENATREGRILAYDDVDRQWRQFNRTYIVLYEPEHDQEVASIIGADMDDDVMWKSALGRVQAELQQERENAFLWFNLGSVYVALEQFEKAAAAFDQARAIGLPWRMLWYQFGPYDAYFHIGRYDDVILLADTTLKDRPYFEEAYYYKGLALAADGDIAAATENWSRAVDFNPNFGPAAHALEAAEP
jgi:tetratricopeptide (TPR) repeat protein